MQDSPHNMSPFSPDMRIKLQNLSGTPESSALKRYVANRQSPKIDTGQLDSIEEEYNVRSPRKKMTMIIGGDMDHLRIEKIKMKKRKSRGSIFYGIQSPIFKYGTKLVPKLLNGIDKGMEEAGIQNDSKDAKNDAQKKFTFLKSLRADKPPINFESKRSINRSNKSSENYTPNHWNFRKQAV